MIKDFFYFLFYPVLLFLSSIYNLLVVFKRTLYHKGILSKVSVRPKVVSVGNLTTGGTGKTPIIYFLAKHYHSKGLRVGVVCRGYKGKFKSIKKVDLKSKENLGDEPTMLALKFQKDSLPVPVYVGVDKSQACQVLATKESVDIILIDDGFQHWKLKRQKDIVIIDSTKTWSRFKSEYCVLPLGRARESWRNLQRADVIFLTKTNWANTQNLLTLRSKLSCFSLPVLEWEFALVDLKNFVSFNESCGVGEVDGVGKIGEEKKPKKQEAWALVSGVGDPQGFRKSIEKTWGVNTLWHKVYPDHYDYKYEDICFILEKLQNLPVEGVIITEKDAVKWRAWCDVLGERSKKIWVAELQLNPKLNPKLNPLEPDDTFF